jgi:hypothetical protein
MSSSFASDGASDWQTREATLARLDALSRLFDIAFAIPGTNVIYEARRLGVPPRIFARMLVNVAIEGIVGAVPYVGDAFDVAFRANRRNVGLLRDYFDGRA